MPKNNQVGFYNTYIFNSSYLSIYVARKNFKKYNYSNNLYKIINKELEQNISVENPYIILIKKKAAIKRNIKNKIKSYNTLLK
jgi:translation initiation factor 2 beta subunit (eIF-2beta)/eIF-5